MTGDGSFLPLSFWIITETNVTLPDFFLNYFLLVILGAACGCSWQGFVLFVYSRIVYCRILILDENPAYGRQQISCRVRMVASIQKGKQKPTAEYRTHHGPAPLRNTLGLPHRGTPYSSFFSSYFLYFFVCLKQGPIRHKQGPIKTGKDFQDSCRLSSQLQSMSQSVS